MADDQPGDGTETPAPIPHVLHVADAAAFVRFGRMFRQLGLKFGEGDAWFDVTPLQG